MGAGVIVAALLGLVIAASFWLAYFDFFTIRGQRLLTERSGARTALARDAYTYLHLPMVTGIVPFAFAMKTTLAHVGDELDTIPAMALCGGSALYLSAYVALRVPESVARSAAAASSPPWPAQLAAAGRPRRAGARRACACGHGVDLPARLRAHLVARSPRPHTRAAPAGFSGFPRR